MKKKIVFSSMMAIAVAGGIIFAADHIDAPAVTGANSASTGADITDIYAFQSPADNTKMVFVMNVQGLMSPAVTAALIFQAMCYMNSILIIQGITLKTCYTGIGSEWKN
jgi:hypothetical protein